MRPFLPVLISVPFSAAIIWNCQQLIRELFAESELIMLRGDKRSELKCRINSDELYLNTASVLLSQQRAHCPRAHSDDCGSDRKT